MDIKIKGFSKELGFSKEICVGKLHELSVEEYELSMKELKSFGKDTTIIPFLGYKDADGKELYQSDVIELKITEELMSTMFANSNLGKYVSNTPGVTSIVLVYDLNKDILATNYTCYSKINNEFDYSKDTSARSLCHGSDTTFPRYMIEKGAKYMGNILESPYLINKLPEFKKNDMFYYSDKSIAVISTTNDDVTGMVIKGRHSDVGQKFTYTKKELIDAADFEMIPLDLDEFMRRAKYEFGDHEFDSLNDIADFYLANFDVSEEDIAYLKERGISINDQGFTISNEDSIERD